MNKFSRRSFLKTSALATSGVLVFGCSTPQKSALVEVLHLPKHFSRRYGDLTANICGRYANNLKQLRYQMNDGQWLVFSHEGPRVPPPLFTLEINAEGLKEGPNQLKIEATPNRGEPEIIALSFDYQSTSIALPLTVDWAKLESNQLDVQDGYWETVAAGDSWRVRPKPGYEDYDRILNVTGAFAGGRRVEADLTFRSQGEDRLYGFGLLPMWGGHPDAAGVVPRRGWSYAIAWFYSNYNGVGAEFSYKYGEDKPAWISSYHNYDYQADVQYQLIVECFPEVNQNGNHLDYRQRMKWFASGEAEPDAWIEVADAGGTPLPESEYAVALVAHRSQVEFGPVTVTPLEARQVS